MGFVHRTNHEALMSAIAHTWLMTRQQGRKLLAEENYDLTFEQILVLHILEEEEGLNLGTIAEKTDRERTTTSRMIDGLEKRNLVVRIPDKTDKRRKLLYLTNLGKERIMQLRPLAEKFVKTLYINISNEEIEATLDTLNKVLKNLEK
jgi:DNA-binding MarR family transcriptional regulator